MSKQCRKCGEVKGDKAFYTGRRVCRKCHAARAAESRKGKAPFQQNPEYLKRYRKARTAAIKRLREAHPDEFGKLMLEARAEFGVDDETKWSTLPMELR